jgi:putative membrane protein
MLKHLAAFLARWVISAAVLMASIGWVTPGNPANTLGRAIAVSALLSVASYLTLARFLWFLFFPWLLYAVVWLATVMGAYGLGFLTALLVAIALTLLHFLVSLLFGVRGL